MTKDDDPQSDGSISDGINDSTPKQVAMPMEIPDAAKNFKNGDDMQKMTSMTFEEQ